MKQPAERVEHSRKDALGARLCMRVAQAALDELKVPVAEIAPREVTEPADRLGELKLLEIGRHFLNRAVEPVKDPAILDRGRLQVESRRSVIRRGSSM